MPEHPVLESEHVAGIAARHGFSSIDPIWDHPRNEALRELRGSPDVLQAGDRLHIPLKEQVTRSASTGKCHRYVVKRPELLLILDTKDLTGEPLRNTACELVLGSKTYELRTDGDGVVKHRVSPLESNGRFKIDEIEFPLRIGRLDPLDSETGQLERLRHLGFLEGSIVEEEDSETLADAVIFFQLEHDDLVVDGICGPNTQKKLADEHGT